MRDRRLAFLGSILKLIQAQPKMELALVSFSHIGWYLTPRYNWRILGSLSEHVLHLFEGGPFDKSGFFIGFISGRYEPKANNVQLFLNGLCAGEKVEAFRRITDPCHDVGFYYETGFWEVKNLARQILGIMPSRIIELPEYPSSMCRRMREPYHSTYLMWLVEQSLSTLIITNDVSVSEEGGLIATPYPLETRMGLPSFGVSTPVRNANGTIDWSRFEPVVHDT
jgi:hypothetical protein